MKFKISVILALFITSISWSQSTINYKAILKDAGGNIVASQLVVIQFQILEGAGQNSVYTEQHTPTTNGDGLVILNIGEGTPINGTFATIDWGNDEHFLNVQVDLGGGLVNMGTSQFVSVPYAFASETAKVAENITGLEALDEGNGLGWRIKGTDSNNYGNIGLDAVDISQSNANSTTLGATGENSVAMGSHTVAPSNSETALGSFNELYTPDGSDEDRLFALGNGTSETDRKNALTILKNGQHIINSESSGLVINSDAFSGIINNQRQGLFLNTPNMTGLWVIGTNDGIIRDDAIIVQDAGRAGLRIANSTTAGVSTSGGRFGFTSSNATQDGVSVRTSVRHGVIVENAGGIGGFFEGTTAGIYAEAQEDANPDLILGGRFASGEGDDGIISSEPGFAGSDIFLRSNDAVVIQLDVDNSETGEFYIEDHNQTKLFEVFDTGGAEIVVPSNTGRPGLEVTANFGTGVLAEGNVGADIFGFQAGLIATSTNNPSFRRPDLVLGGTQNTSTGDDGIISSDRNYAGSDIFLESNDAVVIRLDFDDNENGEFEIKNGANVEVFEVRESGNATLAGTLTQNSDRRLKENIKDLAYGLDEVLQLQPKSYTWKDREEAQQSFGLIAQEVQTVVGELVEVTNTEGDILGIRYIELIPVLINAIQEQQFTITSEKEKVAILEAKLKEFEAFSERLSALENTSMARKQQTNSKD